VVFNNEAKILIKNLYLFKNYSARKLIKKFPEKVWELRAFNYFPKKLCESGSTVENLGVVCSGRSLRMRWTSGMLG